MKIREREYNLKSRVRRTEALYHELGEATYEGNLGAVEVAQFYMNADDASIADFESELEQGNEPAAWDIVQTFHGVNLVGIGSDIDADIDDGGVHRDSVAGHIDEYFNKSRETLSYEILYEMVEAEVKQGVMPKDKAGVVDLIISKLKFQWPEIEPKKDAKTGAVLGITNVGGRFVRLEFAQEVQRIFKNEFGVEAKIHHDDENVARYLSFSHLKSKIKIFQGGSSGRESTYFEANLVVAMNGGEHNGAEFKKNEPKINQDPRYHEAAVNCVRELRKQGMPSEKAVQSSGGNTKGILSDTYKKWGVTSTEAKSDISLGAIGVSVKKAEESQFMSAQGPECAAVFDTVFKNNPNLVEYGNKQVDQFLTQMKRVMGTDKRIDKGVVSDFMNSSGDEKEKAGAAFDAELDGKDGNVGGAYTGKDAVAKALDGASDDLKKQFSNSAGKMTDRKKGTAYQKMIKKAVHLDCDGKIDPESEAIIDGVVSDLGVDGAKPFVEMAKGLEKVLSSDAFRVGVIREGLTGEGKFDNSDAQAGAILKWSIAAAENSRWIVLFDGNSYNDAVFQDLAKSLSLDIRDRGDKRGLALRGDAVADAACNNKVPEINESIDFGDYDMSSYAAHVFSDDELVEIRDVSDAIYKNYTANELVMENWISSLASKGVDIANKSASWVKDKYQSAMKAVSESLAKLWGWIKSLLKTSFSKVLQIFGFAPEQSSFSFSI